jgi:hypothetical protein
MTIHLSIDEKIIYALGAKIFLCASMDVFIGSQYDTPVYLRSAYHITEEEHGAPSEELTILSSNHEDDGDKTIPGTMESSSKYILIPQANFYFISGFFLLSVTIHRCCDKLLNMQ